LDNNHIFQRSTLHIFTMVTSRKRYLTDEEIKETMSNSGSDLLSKDELVLRT